jgi:hypothetical protein
MDHRYGRHGPRAWLKWRKRHVIPPGTSAALTPRTTVYVYNLSNTERIIYIVTTSPHDYEDDENEEQPQTPSFLPTPLPLPSGEKVIELSAGDSALVNAAQIQAFNDVEDLQEISERKFIRINRDGVRGRAREVQPTLELTALTAPLITEICRRLDGLPLALELAAARLKVLSLQTLLERLEHRLHLLTSGPRDLPARQQTLRQTIAWSYDLLSHEEQRLFRLLSVFVNGCTLEAAETVYSTLGGERAQVLDEVTSLLDKHLLYQGDQGDRTSRLLLHEMIREYGLEALVATQELEMARQVHAEYYLGLTEAQLGGAELAVWLEQLKREYANMRAALQWVLERPASEMALRLENVLLHFWEGHQRLSAGSTFLKHALASRQDVPVQMRAKALFTTGAPAFEQDDHEKGAIPDRETVALQRELGNARHLARSLYLLGMITWIIGDFAMAGLYTEEGLATARNLDEKVILAYLIDLSGQIALDQGADTRAQTLLEEGLMLHREAGDTLGSLNALFFLEHVLSARGEVIQARAYAEEHLALSKAIGFRSGIIGTLTFLGRLALEEGNMAQRVGCSKKAWRS